MYDKDEKEDMYANPHEEEQEHVAERVDADDDTGISGSDERNWAMMVHAASFLGWVFPLAGLLGPLIMWLMKRQESAFIDRHGKACVNFQISVFIWAILCIPLIFLIIGIPLLLILVVLDVIYTIINMIKASNGEEAAYPLSIRFIK